MVATPRETNAPSYRLHNAGTIYPGSPGEVLRIAQNLARRTCPIWWNQLPQEAQALFIREAERLIDDERDYNDDGRERVPVTQEGLF